MMWLVGGDKSTSMLRLLLSYRHLPPEGAPHVQEFVDGSRIYSHDPGGVSRHLKCTC